MKTYNPKLVAEVLTEKFSLSPEEVEKALRDLEEAGCFIEEAVLEEKLQELAYKEIKMPKVLHDNILPIPRESRVEKEQRHFRELNAKKKQAFPKRAFVRKGTYRKKS